MLEIRKWSEWYRRSYDGYANRNEPVVVLEVFEDFHPQSGRMDWMIKFIRQNDQVVATNLVGSFLALHTQTERPTS